MFFKNRDRRVFAIGDIHGCARELEALLRKIDPKKDDLVVFLGDYVDRGPDSRRVIDLILDLSTRAEVVALMGNHEAMLLDFLDHPESTGAGLFVLNGGAATLANYSRSDGSFEFPDEHLRFFRGLRLFYETDKYFFVHAGIPSQPLKSLNAKEHRESMLWSRQPFLSSDYDWGKTVVHGHTPVDRVEIKANRINVDTGCVYDRCLTAIELATKKLHQVEKGVHNEPSFYPKELKSSTRISTRFSGFLPVSASRPGEPVQFYETLNYNQFGLLMRDAKRAGSYELQVGDSIEGVIGAVAPKGHGVGNLVRFKGTVVRVDRRGDIHYGVRILELTGGAW